MPACKLTPEVTEIVLQSVAVGCSDNAACQRAGIVQSTLYNWLSRGAAGEEPFGEFARAYTRAKGDRIARLAGHVQDAAPNDWRAAKWLLSVLEPEQYSETRRHEVTGAEGGPIKAEHRVVVNLGDLVQDEDGREIIRRIRANVCAANSASDLAANPGEHAE